MWRIKIAEGRLGRKELCGDCIVLRDAEHEGTVRKGDFQRKKCQAEIKSTGQRDRECMRSHSKVSKALLKELRLNKE